MPDNQHRLKKDTNLNGTKICNEYNDGVNLPGSMLLGIYEAAKK